MKLTTILHTVVIAALSIVSASAAEKNGLVATVSKKTIDRESSTGYYVKTDKTQGLALDVKNNSIKEFPEGEVAWTIVVRRSYEGGNEKFSGKDKLKGLKPSQQAQVIIGAASVTDYRSGYSLYKDKLEYEVVISHEGKETIRLMSTPGFAALAKRATTARVMDDGGGSSTVRPRPIEDDEQPGKGTAIKDKPKPATDKPTPATPNVKPTPKPVTPKADVPPKTEVPPKGDAPPKTEDKPAEDPAEKPFDFFNLDKTKKSDPPAK